MVTAEGWFERTDLVSEAERKLWDAQLDQPRQLNPVYIGPPDPASGAAWELDRQIRAGLIRQILLGRGPDPNPCVLRLEGARITEELSLEASRLACPLDLRGCYFDERISFEQTRAPAIYLTNCNIPNGISADQVCTLNSFELSGSEIRNGVTMLAARIGGQLLMTSTKIFKEDGVSLSAQGLTVQKGAVFRSFVSEGKVVFTGSTFGRGLNMGAAKLTKSNDGFALDAHRLNVKGSLYLKNGFRAEGEVDLTGTRVQGVLRFTGGRFERSGAQVSRNRVLGLARVIVEQNAYLDREFYANGTVHLLDAQIGGSLRCQGGTFTNDTDTAIYAAGITVGRDVELSKANAEQGEDPRGFSADGKVVLSDAKIGGKLDCSGGSFKNEQSIAIDAKGLTAGSVIFSDQSRLDGTVDLRRVQVSGRLQAGICLQASQVRLKGLTYASLGDEAPDLKKRLQWLRGKEYIPQVYRQLASVYQSQGDKGDAKRILVAGESAQFRKRAWPIKVLGWIFRGTVGYGYYPALVLVWLVGLEVVGGVLFSFLRSDMLLAPIYINPFTDRADFHHPLGSITGAHGETDHGYPAYQPWLYTLDLLLPVVNLRQSDIWIPHRAAEWCSIIFIIAGWALATALVVGLGSMFTRDRQDPNTSIP
ncbi:hypothetical protein OHT93_25975 [Streptomyces sp. NBC_00191]|uniref:hypothetical protein n=1 Tax=Streptomyces sp. NBC_00191 TaxID=2975674 RepID=UPI00324DEE56